MTHEHVRPLLGQPVDAGVEPSQDRARRPPALPSTIDVLVVGAGQAGLGAAYWLTRRTALSVAVVDAAQVGQSWRERWDSLELFTPRRFSSLPGLPFPRGRTRCPDRLEMAIYLERYAEHVGLPVHSGVEVRRVTRDSDGHFLVQTSTGDVRAREVVLATGPFARPYVPAAAGGLAPEVTQLHSSAYRRPSDVPSGDVLVVGGGNSAAQLAVELVATHEVTVASPRPLWYLPTSILGIDLYWWLLLTGVLNAPRDAPVSKHVRRRGDAVVGTQLRALERAGEVRVLPHRVVACHARDVQLSDGTKVPARTVLWCTGFRPDTSWIDLPGAIDEDGEPLQLDGASPVPGLHWMGLPWQTRLNSSIIDGVDRDARALVRRISAHSP